MTVDAILHALVAIMSFALGLWAVGRMGPMSSRTRKLDVFALVAVAIGAFGIAAFRVVGVVPPIELIVVANAGLLWWLWGAPVTTQSQCDPDRLPSTPGRWDPPYRLPPKPSKRKPHSG